MIKISKHTKNCTKQTLWIKRIWGQTLGVGGVYCYGKIQLEKGMKRTWTNLIIVVWALLLGKNGEYEDTIGIWEPYDVPCAGYSVQSILT